MSSKRKLRRAQEHQSGGGHAPSGKSRDQLRRQTAAERFAKAGSDKLWTALLGWSEERRARIWLTQAIHDGARRKQLGGAGFSTDEVIKTFAARAPGAEQKLDADSVATAVEVWLSSGDDYTPDDPAPKWHYLANLAAKLGLGSPSPEELQEDWELFAGLALAAQPRAALMAALGQTEQAAVALHAVTRSDGIGAMVNLTRAMWTALAYGDEATFARLSRWSTEWLGSARGP